MCSQQKLRTSQNNLLKEFREVNQLMADRKRQDMENRSEIQRLQDELARSPRPVMLE